LIAPQTAESFDGDQLQDHALIVRPRTLRARAPPQSA
jgi:hypothetical protein